MADDDPDVETRAVPVVDAPDPGGWVLGGRYRVLERIGSGGMAEVFRAHDELLDRDVAIKVFRTMLDDPDATLNAANRRELELQAMARLNHPHLVTLYDGSVAGDGPAYLVLEYVPGENLATRLRSGPLTEPDARRLGAQIADALAYVHAQGLVHRDVKPANILLDGDEAPGRSRLSDFGVVRMVGEPQMTSADLTVGTAYYLAPEQARGSAVGPEADVYALGLVLLETLTGVRAFDGPLHEALAARLAADPAIPPGLPAPWPGLLAAMTARDPAARPDAAAVARHLEPGTTEAVTAAVPALAAEPPLPFAAPAAAAAMASAEPTAAALTAAPTVLPAGPPPGGRRRRFRPGLVAAAVIAVALVAFGAAYLLPGTSNPPAGNTPPPSNPVTTAGTTARATRHTSVPAANVVDQPSQHGSSASSSKTGTHRHRTSAPPRPGQSSSSTPPATRSSTNSSSTSSSPPPSSPSTTPSTSSSSSAPAAAAAAATTSPAAP